MSVIPLVRVGPHVTVVSTKEDFTRTGSFEGHALLIGNFDETQLQPNDRESHLSYDLRVGPEFKDHRDSRKQALPEGEEITLLPGVAVILQTEETVCLPRSMFAYIIPRVTVLQKGISNTVSKVDPGYNGPLVITVFNLGKKTIPLKRGDRICSLVVHKVLDGAGLYEKPAQLISGAPRKKGIQRILDWTQANAGLVALAATILSLRIPIIEAAKGVVFFLGRLVTHR
jgi:dCTP deaminase